MRAFYFTLMVAFTLAATVIGCQNPNKWHEVGGSQPTCTTCGSAPSLGALPPQAMEPPMR